ncbi:MAG TPA: hypothetical protein VF469_11815 [Kofleriaceae bacterium]
MTIQYRVHCRPHALAISSLATLAAFSGCIAGAEPAAPEAEGVIASASTVTYDLNDGAPTDNEPWDSGVTKSLSAWQGVLCSDQIGSERLLVKLEGFREPSLNADNFVARLRATCRNYAANDPLPYSVGFPVVDETDLVFTSDHRDTDSGTAEVVIGGNGDDVPTGIRVKFNDFDGYLKDFQMLYGVAFTTGLESPPQHTSYAMGLSGTEHTLQCPTDFALTGVEVRYSTNTGKVRVIRGKCSLLVHH